MDSVTTLARREVPGRVQAAVILVAFALYLLTFAVKSDGVILGNDVVPYALGLVEGGSAGLWNPHHLAFHPLAAIVARVLALGGSPGIEEALRAQQVLSGLGGALACVLVFRWTAGMAGPLLAGWVTALFGLSAGTWLYASVGETYLPATAAVAGLLTCAGGDRLAGRPTRLVPISAWLVAALLLRQDSVLVVPALWILAGARVGLTATAVAGALALTASAAAWAAAGSELPLWTWLRGLEGAGLWGGAVEGADLPRSLGVLALALLFVPLPFLRLVLATWLAALAGLFPFRTLGAAGRRVLLAFLVTAVVRTAFFTWWQPGNLEFHAGTLLPLALTAGLVLEPEPRLLTRIVRTLPQLASLALVASGNAMLLVRPNQAQEVHERSLRVLDWAGSGDAPEQAGVVVALDRLQFYALQRVPPSERGAVELVDASDAASGLDTTAAPDVRAAIDRHLQADRPVVAVRDVVLADRLGLGEWPVEGYGAIVADLVPVAVEDEHGRRWADIVRARRGP